MPEATPNTGTTSSRLSVSEAANVFEGLLSAEEDNSPAEATTPEPKAPAPRVEPEPEEEPETPTDEPSDEEDGEVEPDDEETDEQPVQPKTRRLKIEGAEVEVTDEELEKGYLRTADYTRKTQQLAEQRKAHEAEQAAVRAEREQYATYLAQLAEAAKSLDQEPDWDKLQQEHPDEFPAAWAAWSRRQEQLKAVEAEQRRITEKMRADQIDQYRAHLKQEEAKLVEAIPAWKDAEVAKKEKAELWDFAKRHGYTDEELSMVGDHRVMVLLRKAMQHDRAEAKRPAVRERIERVKVAAPGPAASSRPPVTDLTRAKQRLAKTGRKEDAAKAIEFLLD